MNNTNTRTWLLAVACAIALSPALQSQTINSQSGPKQAGSSVKAKKSTVKKLDGTKLFGFVEITDDYTIRITSDSGIIRLPIAQLGDADFQKYGFQKDRSKDGRFWYERKEALKDSKEDPKSEKEANSGEKSIAEIRLAEIAAFQPLIAAYEKILAPKSSEKSSTTSKSGDMTDTSIIPVRPMFSQPSLAGPLPQTLPGLGNSGVQSVAGAVGFPSSP